LEWHRKIENIVVDGKAHSMLEKTFYSDTPIEGAKEAIYVKPFRDFKEIFTERHPWKENWHEFLCRFTAWVKKATKCNKKGMKKAVREELMQIRKELYGIKNSLSQHWYRTATLATSEVEAQKIMSNCK